MPHQTMPIYFYHFACVRVYSFQVTVYHYCATIVIGQSSAAKIDIPGDLADIDDGHTARDFSLKAA